MAGGDAALQWVAGVWWDLNTCPVPAGFDPRCVRRCIESALHKQIGHPCAVHIYAMGNLEYMSSDLLEKISSSGITVIQAPCGGNDLFTFLMEWSDYVLENDFNLPAYVLLISCDYTMVNPYLFQSFGFKNFCAYPKDDRPVTLDQLKKEKVFVKEFVWETLLSDNFDNTCEITMEEPLCICDICQADYKICDEFITHLQSEEHRKKLFGIAPIDEEDNPKYFCPVCNYPAYCDYNLLLHNESEAHNRKKKLAEKVAQEEDCQSTEQEEKSTSGSLLREK